MTRLTLQMLHDDIGISDDTPGYGRAFGPRSRELLTAKLTNRRAPGLTEDDFKRCAEALGVPVGHIKGSRKVEAPRGPYDDQGMPTILYERHVFARNCDPVGEFNRSDPDLSASKGYGPGGYGKFTAQYPKLFRAIALDPHAAFAACSWGAFQVLGENAIDLGYENPYEMAKTLVVNESAHLETYRRFLIHKGLVDKLRACKPNDPGSCIPFVQGYNGEGFRQFNYHVQFAHAIAV